jgi:valyl-tRNA synthetase
VFIYATVLTEDGRRMSKSLGTGIDPMGVIEKIGADALRYTLLSQTGYNQDIRYSERRTEEARNFCTKIWNAVRFVLMNCAAEPAKPTKLEPTDRWLLSRLADTEATVREAYGRYDLQGVCQSLYRFFWSELCDWYIEVSKERMSDPVAGSGPQWVLLKSIEAFLKMMHPIMPHLTEEIYSHLPLSDKSAFIATSTWPQISTEYCDPSVEETVERWFEVTRALRALRADLDLPAGRKVTRAFYEGDLGAGASVVASQAWVEELVQGRPPVGERVVSAIAAGVELHLPYGDLIDREKLLAQLERDVQKTQADLARSERRLADPMFVERAKPEIVEKERDAMSELQALAQKLAERRKLFE